MHKYQAADASPGDLAPRLAVMHAVIHRAAMATATASVEAAEQRRAQLVLEIAESAWKMKINVSDSWNHEWNICKLCVF